MKIATAPVLHIPATLAALPQWVCWRLVPDRRHPDGKPKKLPIDSATERAASTTDPATWGTLEEAQGLASRKALAGVGFVFAKDDPFAGGDLDGCLDEDGVVKPWAAPWVERLLPVAHVEVSPSGRGLKFVTRGRLAKALSQKELFGPHEGIELYDWGRYFTITGQALDGCAEEPGDGQAVLDELVAAFAPVEEAPTPPALDPPALPAADAPVAAGWRQDRARAVDAKLREWVGDCLEWARQEMRQAPEGGLHNRRLQLGKFLGGVVAAAPQHLTPDDALGALYGAKVPSSHHSQEIRAIRDGMNTGMGRPLTPGAVGDKDGRDFLPTDEDLAIRDGRAHCPRCGERVRRSRYDYAEGQAPGWYCPRCTWPMQWPLSAWGGGEVAQAGPAVEAVVVPVTAGAETARELPLLLPRARLRELPPATPLIPEMVFVNMLHLWFGEPANGKSLIALDVAATVAQVYNVVYVAAEAIEDFDARLCAWEELHGARADNLYFWRKPIRFAVPGEIERFTGAIRDLRPALVLLDPLASCMSGLVESTQEGMQVAIDAMNAIREATGAGVLTIHHTGWDSSRSRGSSTLPAAARDMARIEKLEDGLIRMTCTKKNQGPPWAPRSFRLVAALDSVVPLPASRVMVTEAELTDRHLAVLEALTQEGLQAATHNQLIDYTSLSKSTVYRLITHLVRGGYVRGYEKGQSMRYSLTPEGHIALEAQHAEPAEGGERRATPRSGRFGWEVCPPEVTGLPAVGVIDADEGPSLPPSRYAEVAGYDDAPPPEGPPDEAETWAGDGGAEPEPEPGPSVAQGLYERLRARKEPYERAVAD